MYICESRPMMEKILNDAHPNEQRKKLLQLNRQQPVDDLKIFSISNFTSSWGKSSCNMVK